MVYDHPPGAEAPPKLRGAAAVVASGCLDANAIAPRIRGDGRLLVVPPDPQQALTGMRPRLRRRLGIDAETMTIQETAGLSKRQGLNAIEALARLPDMHLVFVGGAEWAHRVELTEAVRELAIASRVHFIGEVPVSRRFDYLGEADVGLALVGRRRDRLAAADVFDALGIPFVAAGPELDPDPANRIASTDDPVALWEAIAEARRRPHMTTIEDSTRLLAALLMDLAPQDKAANRPQPVPTIAPPIEAGNVLLGRANALRKQGALREAAELYGQVAAESDDVTAVAVAAGALARLNARGEAKAAIDRVLHSAERPALATARLGEAAAVIGDLTLGRACAVEALDDQHASEPAVRTAIRVLEQVGEPRAALRVARRIEDEAAVSRIEGTLMSYDPTWLPSGRVAGAALPSRVGHGFTLLETSLPHVGSGYTYRARTLLRAQRQAGIEPTVLTRLGFPATRGLSSPPAEVVDGVTHHRAGLPEVQSYTSVPISEQLEANVTWATALGQQIRPEGVIATTPHLNGLVGLALRNSLRVPVIYDVRGFPEMTWAVRRGGGDSDAFGLRRIAETRCMREADLVTTLSETMRQHIISRGISPEKVFVLPHAVDTDEFSPRDRDRSLAMSLGLADRPVVGYISSLVPYEGVETLLDALAHLRRERPDVAGLIVGDGELLPTLEAQARRIGLANDVVFTGRVNANEIARYYSLTDIFVCPRQDHEVTRYVTPLKPFEAMAAGGCVVVSDLPTLREAVGGGDRGGLFPAGDSEALARTLLALVDRPEHRRELGAAARAHAVANHGLDVLSTKVEQVWGELRQRSREAP